MGRHGPLKARTDLSPPSTCSSKPGHGLRPASWSAQCHSWRDNQPRTDCATGFGLLSTWPRATPSTDEDLQGGSVVLNDGTRQRLPCTKTFSTSSDQTSPSPDFNNFLCFRCGVSLLDWASATVVIFMLSWMCREGKGMEGTLVGGVGRSNVGNGSRSQPEDIGVYLYRIWCSDPVLLLVIFGRPIWNVWSADRVRSHNTIWWESTTLGPNYYNRPQRRLETRARGSARSRHFFSTIYSGPLSDHSPT